MKWITRAGVKVDRVACPWLIKKFIDPEAEFLFVPAPEVLKVAQEQGAISFDAEGATYGHRGGKCTFEVLVEEYGLNEPGLGELAAIVHGADVTGEEATTPQSSGLKAIAEGFQLRYQNDHMVLEKEFPVYEALYTWCLHRNRLGGGSTSV